MIITEVKLDDVKDLPLLYSFSWSESQQSGTSFYRQDVPFSGLYEVWIRNIAFSCRTNDLTRTVGLCDRICLMSNCLQVPIMNVDTRLIGGSDPQSTYVIPQFNTIDLNFYFTCANGQSRRGFHLGAIEIPGFITARIAYPQNNTNPTSFVFCAIDLELKPLGRSFDVSNVWKLPKHLPLKTPICRQLVIPNNIPSPFFANIPVGIIGKYKMRLCADYFALGSQATNQIAFAITSPCFRIAYNQTNFLTDASIPHASPGQTFITSFDFNRHGSFAEPIEIDCEIYNSMPIKWWNIGNNNNSVGQSYSSLVLFVEFYPL